jgi:hypothetical protein
MKHSRLLAGFWSRFLEVETLAMALLLATLYDTNTQQRQSLGSATPFDPNAARDKGAANRSCLSAH